MDGTVLGGETLRGQAQVRSAVRRAQLGDGDALRFLYLRYAASVRRCAAALLQDADAAEDVVQTTFLKLLTRLSSYEPREVPFEAWLLRVARNTALDECRRRRARPACAPLEGDTGLGRTAEDAAERAAELAAALRSLPADEAKVLVLRHLVGLSRTETAARMQRTETAVDRLQARARAGVGRALRQGAAGRSRPAREGRGHRPVAGTPGRRLVEGLN
jgi:RNA polymerase sigma-70 factor, ECF subfamily